MEITRRTSTKIFKPICVVEEVVVYIVYNMNYNFLGYTFLFKNKVINGKYEQTLDELKLFEKLDAPASVIYLMYKVNILDKH